MKKELKYRIRMFKIDGHQTWRITMEQSFPVNVKVTNEKVIEIDRLTGKIKVIEFPFLK